MVNSQCNLLDVESRQADTDQLRQDILTTQTQLTLALQEKEALCQTCEEQATVIAEMKARLEEIRDWKIQAERYLKQLNTQEQDDPDLLFRNERFIEQFQALQDLNEQLYQENEGLSNALERAHEKIRNLEDSSGIQHENQRLTDALNQQIEVSRKKIDQLQQALVEKQRLLSIANSNKETERAIEQQHAASANEIAGLRLQLETKASELEKVTAELQSARGSQQLLLQELQQHKNLIEQLQSQETTPQLQPATGNILTPEASQLQQELDAALQRIGQLEQSLNQERAILNITQKEMQKYHKMTSELQEKICQMNAERAQLKNSERLALEELAKMNGQINSVNVPTNAAFPTPGMIRTQESMQQLQEELQRRKNQNQSHAIPDSTDLISSISQQ